MRLGFCDAQSTPSAHASTVVAAADGSLVAAWFAGNEEGGTTAILVARHVDTWLEPMTVTDREERTCWNPVLWKAADDQLWLWYKVGPSPVRWAGFVRRSTDHGRSWSAPEALPKRFFGPVRAKPFEADGRLLAPTSIESHGYEGLVWTGYVDQSEDGGHSWSRGTPIAVPGLPFGVIQPTLFRKRDGMLVALLRSTPTIGRICRAESKDLGRTWTPAWPTELPNPNSGIDVLRLRDGRLLLVYNHATGWEGRGRLDLATSTDDGDSWSEPWTIERGRLGGYSYPAVIQTADDEIHLTYTWRRKRIRHVMFWPSELP